MVFPSSFSPFFTAQAATVSRKNLHCDTSFFFYNLQDVHWTWHNWLYICGVCSKMGVVRCVPCSLNPESRGNWPRPPTQNKWTRLTNGLHRRGSSDRTLSVLIPRGVESDDLVLVVNTGRDSELMKSWTKFMLSRSSETAIRKKVCISLKFESLPIHDFSPRYHLEEAKVAEERVWFLQRILFKALCQILHMTIKTSLRGRKTLEDTRRDG